MFRWSLLFALAACGCGGGVQEDAPPDAPAPPDAGVAMPDARNGVPDAPAIPDADSEDVAVGLPDADALAPECPDVVVHEPAFACDPLAPPEAQCAPGEACYAWVERGAGACDTPHAASACSPSGTKPEGAPCTTVFECSPGLACVYSDVYTCRPYCVPGTIDACTSGQICEQIANLPGLGACD